MRLTGMSLAVQSFIVAWVCLHPFAMDAGLTAMCMNYSGQVTIYLQHLINCFTQLEIEMNSIERVKHYSEIDTEAAFDETDDEQLVVPDESWPREGKIELIKCCARYRPELPLVCNDVSFVVNPRQKVGICGRTGSGKSTLMQMLFRILELDSGVIKIDDVDIKTIGLRQLRTGIAILPQDPTLFTGSIRENVDPFDQYTDEQLWTALERAQMKEAVEKMPQKLKTPVGEGGESFSVGERQLLCLARSILTQRRLLIMDECTASVDVETDAKIQSMIRHEFSECTVFAIAHRLDTIIDYDRIAVLDKGHLKEYDSPANLLEITDGIFASLVEETGPTQAPRLKALARGDPVLTPRASSAA